MKCGDLFLTCADTSHDALGFGKRFPQGSFVLISLQQTTPRLNKVWLEFHRSLALRDSVIVTLRTDASPADINVRLRRKRIEFLRAFDLRQPFIKTLTRDQ